MNYVKHNFKSILNGIRQNFEKNGRLCPFLENIGLTCFCQQNILNKMKSKSIKIWNHQEKAGKSKHVVA